MKDKVGLQGIATILLSVFDWYIVGVGLELINSSTPESAFEPAPPPPCHGEA